jgi:hypothetical protein
VVNKTGLISSTNLKIDNKAENIDDPNKVGKEEVKFGFGVGKAPNNSKPTF